MSFLGFAANSWNIDPIGAVTGNVNIFVHSSRRDESYYLRKFFRHFSQLGLEFSGS